MGFINRIIGNIISLPARLKGMKIGKNSCLGPGYDFIQIQLKGIVLGDNVFIGKGAQLEIIKKSNGTIRIGDDSNIGRYATFVAMKKISIGNRVLISYNVSIRDYDHKFRDLNTPPIWSGFTEPEEIVIEDNCFIGAHTFISKGVHLGKHCIVGANSVVTKSFPAYSVIAGSPAKLIEKLT